MQIVLVNSLLAIFILIVSCKNLKNDKSAEVLYTAYAKDSVSKNTYELVYNTEKTLRAVNLNFKEFGTILISYLLEDSLGLNYAMHVNEPLRINLSINNKKIKTFFG